MKGVFHVIKVHVHKVSIFMECNLVVYQFVIHDNRQKEISQTLFSMCPCAQGCKF